MLKIKLILCSLVAISLYTEIIHPKLMIVNVAVANLRYQPQANDPELQLPTSDTTNPLQITQLLFGEYVITHETYIDDQNQMWYYVNTMQQEFFQDTIGWHGYPGWIQAKDLLEVTTFLPNNIVVNQKFADIYNENNQKLITVMLGTRFYALEKTNHFYKILLPDHTIAYIQNSDVYEINPLVQETEQQLRSNIIQTAKKFIGDWYSWGGRSSQNNNFSVSSVDCSALVHLSFLAHGLQIPRMSHEQFLKSEKIQYCADLQPGDLIYFVSITKHSIRMDHVMMYLGNDQILESTYADDHKVRIVSFPDRMGKPCNLIRNSDQIIWNDEEFYVYFGSFLQNKELVQDLRNKALKYKY